MSDFLSRRRFLAGAASLVVPKRGLAAPAAATTFHITEQRLTIDGKTAPALLINGSLPAPLLRWREGTDMQVTVHNHLDVLTSVHWHGLRVPSSQDGVPGLSYAGIAPRSTFTYHLPLRQSGTYWYHSHVAGQEPRGMYGPLILDPAGPDPLPPVARDYIIFLSTWTDVLPPWIASNLKMDGDYYNFRQRSVASLPMEARRQGGMINALEDRLMWSGMRMSATDISDTSGVILSYLLNGQANMPGWSGLFRKGERVRLRFINGSAMTLYDVRLPGLPMQVVEADGNAVQPFEVDEFRIGVGETYVVDVVPEQEKPYTIFVQSEDRTGYARGTLTPRLGWYGPVPPMDPRPVRTMVDMGMSMGPGMKTGMSMPGPDKADSALREIDDPGPPPLSVENQWTDPHPTNRTASPGDGLEHTGRRVLNYTMLRALHPQPAPLPTREIVMHLTGNMERYIWGFNGRKFSQSGPIRLLRNERVRFRVINDTMMEHPLHLHGLWSQLENGQGEACPLKHTIISQPGSVMRFLVTADTPGRWAWHCHLAYHMDTGMFRVVEVL
ncbi:copper resistance system multicopper oxidase [Oecophyllibacter saccharovorans]|uniref:Copper resistance system multicopper oxidase n=1 Tax=Oecophyllibacter saccharovorans TaxID=2558360 RepID=A0A506ULC8_9PROT|nr:copper resistance system multicopper oxidase [Oecophyllibacter saccharovorans]TPW33973.1 copper resistance system multicopper oxidase [Oecophyllibacter saccharovorans]